MPLKNPKTIPAIPRTRAKTVSKIKAATPREKEPGIEYLCQFYFSTDKTRETQKYCISLSTVRQFSALNYEISVKTLKVKNSIDISILGLNTKADYINKHGAAECVVCFENLYGRHTINIIKQDGSINSAVVDFNIYKKQIELVKVFLPHKTNNRNFCRFEIADDKFNYSKKGGW